MARGGALLGLIAALAASPALGAPSLTERLLQVDRATVWTPAASIPVQFPTFHPQGMVRIGEEFFVSSVEVKRPPTRDDPGAGVGHLFRISADGALLADLTLGEGDAYHPGGLDYDGRYIWVPVAEYRPDSRAIVYRVDPNTMTATEVLRTSDHIGAVVHDRETGMLHGVSWGSRRFYDWKLKDAAKPAVTPNRSSYVDYQDCHGLPAHRMLCSGVATYRSGPGAAFALGGWEISTSGTTAPSGRRRSRSGRRPAGP